jgi:putative protein kinase ArgK-like GTPase of G3E family
MAGGALNSLGQAAALKHLLRTTDDKCEILFVVQRKVARAEPTIAECFDKASEKQMLVETILSKMPDKMIVSVSGLAGYGKSNSIQTDEYHMTRRGCDIVRYRT